MEVEVNSILNHCGPAPLVCFAMVIGVFYPNSRIRGINKRIDDSKDSLRGDIRSLRELLKAEVSHLSQRIDRLEIPLVRK